MRTFLATLLFSAVPLLASPNLTILVDGSPREELVHRGTTYIEAMQGREYSLRITNPTPYRVAVALSVDGLNTIDARHTDAFGAAKWVLGPYESADIDGWQVSDSSARRFFFTGERNSYGAAIGKTENLGVIEAVFFRERERRPRVSELNERQQAPSAAGASSQKAESDDYAATGMGDRTRHEIEMVSIDLDPSPVASARIRYEFHPQLVKLGVLPRNGRTLDRRERARGFCPEP
ncbi:MAG: hypothetical protein ABI779_03410 [Acidobacteriota bacterium]